MVSKKLGSAESRRRIAAKPRRLAEPSSPYFVDREPRVLVDTNVLLDILQKDPAWQVWSAAQLAPWIAAGRAVIMPIIYAELSADYTDADALDAALAPLELKREALTWQAAFLAGKAYKLYRKRGGVKRLPLADFFIGAHALVGGLTLLTRDPKRYRDYFPKLKVIAPK